MNVVTECTKTQKVWNPYPTEEEAEQYDKISTVQQSWAFSTLEKCEFLKEAKNVLDIGCGTGIVTANLEGRVKKGIVIGLDVSDSMIKIAKKKFGEENTNLSFQVGNAMDLTFKENSYDVATAFNSLHWLSDPIKGLREIYRVLIPKGKVVIVVPDSQKTSLISKKVAKAVGSVFGSDKWRKRLASLPKRERYTKEKIQKSLEQAGFKDIKVSVTQVESVFKNRKDLETWMYASFCFLKMLPEEDKRWKLAKELTTKSLEFFKPEKDGSIKLPGSKIEAIAQK